MVSTTDTTSRTTNAIPTTPANLRTARSSMGPPRTYPSADDTSPWTVVGRWGRPVGRFKFSTLTRLVISGSMDAPRCGSRHRQPQQPRVGRSLRPQHEGGWRPRRAAPRKRSDDIGEHDRAQDDDDHRRQGNCWLGNGEDLMCEQDPEPPAEPYSEWYADHDPYQGGDRCLGGDNGRQLSTNEPDRLQQGEISPPPTNGCGECHAERDDGPYRQARSQQRRRASHGAVVHDLGRVLDGQ